MEIFAENSNFQEVEMSNDGNNSINSSQYLGPSTSSFSNFEIIDLDIASKNHINDNDSDIEEETQSIMKEIKDSSEPVFNKRIGKGIVLQIVKEKGNLKSKQISKTNKNICKNSENLFACENCMENFNKLDELLNHIKIDHKDVQIPREYETLLNKQLVAIAKVKTTAYDLINLSKFKAVETLLETSKKSLDSFKMDIFGKGDTNIFKNYVINVYNEIYNNLNESKKKDVSDKVTKKGTKKNNGIKNILDGKIKKNKKATKKSKINSNAEFSSEDELCLKDSILKSDEKKKDVGADETTLDEDLKELYLQFYAVPYKTSGNLVTLYEIESLRMAVKNMWDGVLVDLSNFNDIMIKRYEREMDEVLPDDTLFTGYASRNNTSVFTEPKKFKDIFDKNFLLNDGINPHKDNKTKTSRRKNAELDNEAVEEISTKSTNTSDNIKEAHDLFDSKDKFSDSDDSYDDGFNKATEFLTQIPGKKFKRSVFIFGKCDLCNEECLKKNDLIKHMNQHHADKWNRYICKICGVKMLPRIKLWKHFKIHTNKILYECELCCETFVSDQHKNNHIQSEHIDLLHSFICCICKSTFDNLSLLQSHFSKNHNNAKDLQIKDIVESSVSATSESRPVCKICHRTFTSVGRLTQHITAVHEKKKKNT